MKLLPVITLLLVAPPVLGQSRLYTNADLGRPLSPERVIATPEELRALAARQFRLPPTPDRSDGPSVIVFDSTPAFARSTDALIDMPANYTTDMHLANHAAIYQARHAGIHGGSPRRR